MSPRNPRPEGLASSPVVRHSGHWWLVTGNGSTRLTDPAFIKELDGFAVAMAAADQAVADLRAKPHVETTQEPQ